MVYKFYEAYRKISAHTHLKKHSIVIKVYDPPTGQYRVLVVRRHPCQDYHNEEDAETCMVYKGGGSDTI